MQYQPKIDKRPFNLTQTPLFSTSCIRPYAHPQNHETPQSAQYIKNTMQTKRYLFLSDFALRFGSCGQDTGKHQQKGEQNPISLRLREQLSCKC